LYRKKKFMGVKKYIAKGIFLVCMTLVLCVSSIPSLGIDVIKPRESRVMNTEIPSSFDWRNVDGVDYTTSIKNQAPAPTCEAYGLCAALETIIQYKIGHPFGCDLSEAHLFFYAGGSVERGGVRLSNAADYLIDHGVPDEGCFPDPHRPYDSPFESIPGWENRTVKITTWGWIEKNETAIKQSLITYGPLVVCIYSRENLLLYRHGIYMPRGKINGGHVVAITGYNDTERCWIIRNSAGEDWGEDGYVRVSYDADTEDHPFFADFYGGTGIMYIDGVYGNFIPDVPSIQIETPTFFHTYLLGLDIPTLFRSGIFMQKGAPRILGKCTVEVNVTNTEKVEFYIDGNVSYTDEESPFTWELAALKGLHTLETYAYRNDTISKDIVDVFIIR